MGSGHCGLNLRFSGVKAMRSEGSRSIGFGHRREGRLWERRGR